MLGFKGLLANALSISQCHVHALVRPLQSLAEIHHKWGSPMHRSDEVENSIFVNFLKVEVVGQNDEGLAISTAIRKAEGKLEEMS